ncbi:MAG: hypothetical protein LBE31_02475 [Deltaproteobacteria bacterium]|jgi:hypothetical protein|nr:hypothetical protein [Deltaproteobacteria bacterium]
MAIKRVNMSVEEVKKYLASAQFFGDYGTSRLLTGFYEDDETNSAILYGFTLKEWTVAHDRAFLFYNNVTIPFELRRDKTDTPTQDYRSPDYKVKLSIISLFIPSNLKNKTEEIQHLIYRYVVAFHYTKTELFNVLKEKSDAYVVDFPRTDYICGKWAIENSRIFTLLAYGPNLKKKQMFNSSEPGFIDFINGVRINDQLYLFRVVYDEMVADVIVLYQKKSETEAVYKVNTVAIPDDFLSQRDFLISLIPKALLYFSNIEENIKVKTVDIDNFILINSGHKIKLFMSKYGPIGPLVYPLFTM